MSKSKRARVRKTGLSTQPWRKADVAFLQERAAAVGGLTLRFTMEGSRLRPRVRTVHVETDASETALAFITEHFGLASSPYRARAITHMREIAPPVPAPPTPAPELELRCSFCGKHRNEAKHLVAGPGVYICDSCVVLCCDVIDHHDGPEKIAPYDLDEQSLVLIAKLVRAVPTDVPDAGVPAAIDKMMDEQLRDVSRWRDLRGLPNVSVASGQPSVGGAWSEAILAAAGIAGPLAYLWAAQKGKKTSPTSAEGAASSTVGERNQ